MTVNLISIAGDSSTFLPLLQNLTAVNSSQQSTMDTRPLIGEINWDLLLRFDHECFSLYGALLEDCRDFIDQDPTDIAQQNASFIYIIEKLKSNPTKRKLKFWFYNFYLYGLLDGPQLFPKLFREIKRICVRYY